MEPDSVEQPPPKRGIVVGSSPPALPCVAFPGDAVIIIKSHVYSDYTRNRPAEIKQAIRKAKFEIVDTTDEATIAQFETLYEEHAGKPYYSRLIASVTGPTLVMWVRDTDPSSYPQSSIDKLLALCGPTSPETAISICPETIRGKHSGADLPWNAVHRSDGIASGMNEVNTFFG